MTQERKKSNTPLHLRLTCEDWVETFKELNRAELGVLYYIRCLDPYGDRELDVDSGKLAEVLGIHRTSVSRALLTLRDKKLINMEVAKVKVSSKAKNRKTTLLCMDAHRVHGRTSVSADAQPECMDAQAASADAHQTYIRNAHAHQTYSDLIQTNQNSIQTPPLTPQGAQEEREAAKVVEVEVVEEGQNDIIQKTKSKTSSLAKNQNLGNGKSSAKRCDNKEKAEWLLQEYDAGRITTLPKDELLLLAGEIIGDYVQVYRRSGVVLSSKPNDIDKKFVRFVADKHCRGDMQNADTMICNAERNPERWRVLVGLVEAWQQSLSVPRLVDENGEEATGATAEALNALANDEMLQLFMSVKSDVI